MRRRFSAVLRLFQLVFFTSCACAVIPDLHVLWGQQSIITVCKSPSFLDQECAIYVRCFNDNVQFLCDVLVMYFNARFSIALARLGWAGLKIDNLDGVSITTKTFVTFDVEHPILGTTNDITSNL